MFKADVHEPMDIARLIQPSVKTFQIENLNDAGWADYVWQIPAEKRARNTERKTWGDLVSNLDEVELLIGRHLLNHPEARNTLLIEGVAEPAPQGVLLYRKRQGQNIMLGAVEKDRRYGLFKDIYAWLNQVSNYVELTFTASYSATASALHAMYENDQKLEHTTLRRHLKITTFHPNVQVMRLMGIAGNDTNLGAVKCERLIAHFGTVWNVCDADPMEIATVDGIGLNTAKTFLRKIGRGDV